MAFFDMLKNKAAQAAQVAGAKAANFAVPGVYR